MSLLVGWRLSSRSPPMDRMPRFDRSASMVRRSAVLRASRSGLVTVSTSPSRRKSRHSTSFACFAALDTCSPKTRSAPAASRSCAANPADLVDGECPRVSDEWRWAGRDSETAGGQRHLFETPGSKAGYRGSRIAISPPELAPGTSAGGLFPLPCGTLEVKVSRPASDKHDEALEDSFPASDPPATSGIVGPKSAPPRPEHAPHERDDDTRPKGTPTHDRHATETSVQREQP